jgi:hypothetical protein
LRADLGDNLNYKEQVMKNDNLGPIVNSLQCFCTPDYNRGEGCHDRVFFTEIQLDGNKNYTVYQQVGEITTLFVFVFGTNITGPSFI